MSWTWWSFVAFTSGLFAFAAFAGALVLLMGKERFVGVHLSKDGRRGAILGHLGVGAVCLWFCFDPPSARSFSFVLIGYAYGAVLVFYLVRSIRKKSSENRLPGGNGTMRPEEVVGDDRQMRGVAMLTVLLTCMLSVVALSFSYGDGPPALFWLARLPWAVCLALTGLLYGRKAWRIAPLLLTVFVAFPELFFGLASAVRWEWFGR